MDAERKLKRAKISLLRDDRYAFWRGVMMIGKTEIKENIPTACTDGCNEYYGRALVDTIDEKMLKFVILHENLHKIERHLTTWKKLYEEDKDLANMACDYRINLQLHESDPLEQNIAFPKYNNQQLGLLDKRFKGMSVPEIYRLLKQKQEQNGGGVGQGQGQGFDEHDWDGASERTEAEQQQLEKEIDQALRQGEMEHRRIHGDKAGELERQLQDLLKPQIDWREVLADFVRGVCSGRDSSTWRRPNRRFLSQDILLPSLISERIGKLAVGVDTSGSIGGAELTALLSEVVSIARDVKPEKIDLLYWDTRVARHEEYDETKLDLLPSSTKPAGGGGTDVNCVTKYLEEKNINPECLVILTDGYTPWPSTPPGYPVLWVITTKTITAPFGTTVHMNA